MPTRYIGDSGPDLTGVVTFTGSPVITGGSAVFYMCLGDGSVPKINGRTVTITGLDDGTDTFTWTVAIHAGDVDTAGAYVCHMVFTFADAEIITIPITGTVTVQSRGC